MEKLLITGAGGYIGSVTCLALLEAGYEVIALDNFYTGFQKPLQFLVDKFGIKKIRYYNQDLAHNLNQLFSTEKNISAVIHFAGVCSIDESLVNPMLYFTNNLIATQNLLESMRQHKIKRLIFSSSCSVYKDLKKERPRLETDPLEPTSPYGESKSMAEKVIEWYGKIFDIKYLIFRYFNVCGAHNTGVIGDSKNPSAHLVHNAILGALNLRPFSLTFPEVDTTDGSPVRDYIDIHDLIDAHQQGLSYLLSNPSSQILNLGTGVGHSVKEVVKKVESICKVKMSISQSKSRLGEYPIRIASWQKANEILGWQPKRSLEDSIISSKVWYQTHPARWL